MDLRPLTQKPEFGRLWLGSTLGGLGGQLTVTAVMLHMFDITGSTLAVAMIAVAGLLPMIVAGLYGGMLSDRFDRRSVALSAALVTWVTTVVLAVVAWTGNVTEWWLYALSIVISAANSVVGTSKSSMTPRLVGDDLISAAAALNGISVGIMVMAGPAAGGLLVAFVGYPMTYMLDAVLMLSLFLGLWTLPRLRPAGSTGTHRAGTLGDGLRFLKSAPNLRTQFLLDIAAMVFGHPTAILPAVGVFILGGGAITTGLLTAAVAVGAFASGLFSGRIGGYPRHGLGIVRSVQAFGAATVLFGLTLFVAQLGWLQSSPVDEAHPNVTLLIVACFTLILAGAADNVSSIFRTTMLLQATPDAYRGRLQGVFTVVVTGGPRVGALYYGVFASFVALWVPAVVGGLAIIGIAAATLKYLPAFRQYDSRDPRP
ncbi:MFS transporter [Paenarthrobacter sp. NCHU4564]|uniref:MFS transporter n=1 Tax=Paenarthrobacter sp. NCHU4564 TaxID=3451353 RepID=UPI003F9C3F85